MKSKFVFGLIAVMLVLVLAPSSFAQVNITINNPPSAQEVQTNRAAETSDPTSSGAGITVSGALLAESALSMTDLILTFPGVITSSLTVPTGDPIRIIAATGLFNGAVISTITSSSIRISLLTQDIGDDEAANTLSGSFRLVGTRINANGLTAPLSAMASLSSTANNFFLNTPTFPLISALGPGIASVTQGAVTGRSDLTTIQIFTNRTVTDDEASAVITEGFPFAWRSDAQNEIDAPGAADVVASQIRITVSGIPEGATLSYSVQYPDTTPTALLTVMPTSGTLTSATSSSNQATFEILTSDPAEVESFQLNFTLTPDPLTITPTAGNITFTATMFPNPASSAGANALSSGRVPTYTAAQVGPATIGSIITANTTMLVSYALLSGPFDTGIQILNTTADPFGSANGGATPTAGNLVFHFFPRNPAGGAGTPFTLSTSASTVFGGLSADGTLAPGGTFVALLSEILSFTSAAGSQFSGYAFVTANFLGAHGNATISDFRTYSLATNVLVLPPPASKSRNTPENGAEALAF